MLPKYISNDCPLHNSLMQFTKGCKGGISVQLQKTFGNFDLISSFFLKDGWAMIRICKTVHWSHQLSQHSVNNIIWVTEMGLQWNKHVDIQSMIFTSESTMVVQLVVGGDGVQLHLCERRWMVRQGEGNNLLVEWTHKALCEGTTSRLANGTCQHLERFCLKVGKTTLKKSCTRTKAWKGVCVHKEGLFNNYLQDHSFGLGNLGHILLSTSQRLKGN